ncbi:helix-turn-helix domain-containing protein [Spirosoma validum]|uniref:Helix-turn-helix transcriptional regulator n=1 Tax=Spirosoma validum TaxID=2771355 RepID=A0A927GDT8_9BACT|nr:helix-turn-helix transcriptional regulator [Spirosoma validum]MBD2754074.1 helix-turn-helix transcriptional regulator [Spirosoma validum]
MEQLAERVRVLRMITGYPQDYVAFKLGISQAAYSKKETGRTILSLQNLSELAELYQLSIRDIVGATTEELVMLVMRQNTRPILV